MAAVSPRVQMLLAHARKRPTDEAAELLLAEIGNHHSAPELLRLLADTVQAEVGREWQHNGISVVEEHVASVVVEQALVLLERSRRDAVPLTRLGRIVMACPEGEAHTLASRMAALLFRWAGWEPILLGGPAPADDLRDFLASSAPDAVALTCVTGLGLRGVPDVAAAARAIGVPCVAGGSGFGAGGRHARRLGVRWAATPEAVAEVLKEPEPAPEPDDLPERIRRYDELAQVVQTTVGAACIRLSLDLPVLMSYSEQEWARTRDELSLLLRYLGAAVLVDDWGVFADVVAWDRVAMASRGLPDDLLTAQLRALHAVLPRPHSAARTILVQVLADC